MKAFVVFSAVLAIVAAESCYKDVEMACSNSKANNLVAPCNATYGNPHITMKELIDFANNHIVRSYEYLLMATHYGNYQKNRAGFEKLFHDLSDEKWQASIDIIKHITRRGGAMAFTPPKTMTETDQVYELYEMQSIAKALDIEKQLALQAFRIHNQASERHEARHDPEIATYMEKEFVHEQAEVVRKLAGHVTDLNSMLKGPDSSLALYLFDEYLQK